jgi:ornithine--oxo-acid transaminase
MEPSMEMFWKEIADKGVRATVAKYSDEQAIDLTLASGAHNYGPLQINIVRGVGGRVWDGSGNEFLDCIGAYSAVSHGHANEFIAQTVREQIEKLTLTGRSVYCSEMALFFKGLASYCNLDLVCPMNTGAEAVETSIKIARKWAYIVKGIPKNKAEIVTCSGNFHGRTISVISFSTVEQYRNGFGPYTPGYNTIPFGDIDALEKAITPNTAAFLCEPIQAEGGVIVPPPGYMRQVRELCDRNNVLLIWDEIQTGFCRTGRRFAWMYEDARPDIVTVGKALGGGILPVSAAVGKREVIDVLTPGDHGSTFGGNPFAAAIGLAAMAEMEVNDYAGRSERLGERLLTGLKSIFHPSIKEVRGKGLLVGLEVNENIDTVRLQQAFVTERILTKETRQRTFRLTPPITVDERFIDEVVDRVHRAICSSI